MSVEKYQIKNPVPVKVEFSDSAPPVSSDWEGTINAHLEAVPMAGDIVKIEGVKNHKDQDLVVSHRVFEFSKLDKLCAITIYLKTKATRLE